MSGNGKSIKRRLENGEIIFGTFTKLASPFVIEMLGLAGFDFIIVDMEHGNYSYNEAQLAVLVANSAGMDAIIRVPNATEQNMMHALDIGAQGVQVPNLTTVAEVENALQKAKYVPLGTRGLATTTRAALYTLKTPDEHIRHVNNETLFVAMIENTEIAGHVSEICQIPGVDVLFIGTSDLSQSLGVPGRVHEESVQSAVREIVRKAHAYGKRVGIVAATEEDVKRYIDLGIQYIAYSGDSSMIVKMFEQEAKRLKEIAGYSEK